MYGIILSNICCSFVCVSIEQLGVTIDVGRHCTGGRCGKDATLVQSKDDKVILRTCNIQ